MVLLAAAKKGTQKKMRKKEIGLSQGIDHHELVDEDIYKLAIEFAEKKENKEKVDKVRLDFQKQKLEAGLSKYVEEKRMETKEERRKRQRRHQKMFQNRCMQMSHALLHENPGHNHAREATKIMTSYQNFMN